MASIKRFEAIEILDSLGFPTLRGRLYLDNGDFVELDIPSPVVSDPKEPVALRDGGKRFLGYGMRRAAQIITEGVTQKLKGVSVFKQKEIDLWLEKADSTLRKEVLGVSTLLLVSLLVAKAAAKVKGEPLFKYINELYKSYFKEEIILGSFPTIVITLINGGKHVNNPLDFKEFYLIPSSSYKFDQALEIAMSSYHKLKETLEYRNISTSTADLGGFSPNIYSNLDALELITESVLKLDLKPGVDVFLGVDVGADDFYSSSGYKLSENPQAKRAEEFYKYIAGFVKNYNVLYLEDIFSRKDTKNWKQFYQDFSEYYYVSLDHMEAFGKEGLENLVKEKLGNAVVIKLLHYGNLLSLFKDIDFCRKNKITYVFCQEVSETNQSFIADLAVGLQSGFVKFGAPVRGERVVKYNRLLEIQKELENLK